MKAYADFAVAFAAALVDHNFSQAHSMLSPTLQEQITPDELRINLQAMFPEITENDTLTIHFDDEFQMDEWHSKLPGDVGWVYIGIWGTGSVEAVTVVVTALDGMNFIRDIIWGRP